MSTQIDCRRVERLAIIERKERRRQDTFDLGHKIQVSGIAGLIDYVEKSRREDFERNLCRKFLGYALGRSVNLSDQPLLEEMQKKLHAEQRFSVLFETVVLAKERYGIRGRELADVVEQAQLVDVEARLAALEARAARGIRHRRSPLC